MPRRFPSSLPGPVRGLVRWLDDATVPAGAAVAVPGASAAELRRLAALGGLARALVPGPPPAGWPPELAAWAGAGPPLPPTVAKPLLALLDGPEGAEHLARVYEWTVSGTNRRRLGTFFTPPALTHHMLTAAAGRLGGPPAAVADPGAGVGAFTVAARARWPDATVTAVDVNTVTLGLLAALLARSGTGGKGRVDYALRDYLAWLTDTWPGLPGPRLIVGNPPYTRNQQMDRAAKTAARAAAGSLVTSGLAGLSSYFLAASLLALGDRDALSLLLPTAWCETRYGREIRGWLWGQTDRHVRLDMFPARLAVFPGTQVTAMVLTVGPRRDRPQPFEATAADITAGHVTTMRTVTAVRSGPCPLTFTGLLRVSRPTDTSARRLGAHATVRRGVATGASDFFFLTDQGRDDAHLPPASLRPAFVKPGHLPAGEFTDQAHAALGPAGRARWLLDLNEHPELAESDPGLRAYLALGTTRGVPTRHLASHRPYWYVVERVAAPDLFLCPVGKDAHRVVVNEARAVCSNNLYGLYLHDDAPWTAHGLTSWLRSDDGQGALRHLARTYHGGSLKIEPRSLRDLLVPRLPSPG